MSATTPISGEQQATESRRERMKRTALEGIGSATPKVKGALHAGANAIEANAEQCGELAADVVECLLTREDSPDSQPGIREPVSSCCSTLVTDAVRAGRPHIDPAVDRTADCTSRAAASCIGCAADTADFCRQRTGDLCGRVTSNE